MRVMKFGGASVSTPANVQNIATIALEMHEQGPIVIVTSAMGKNTNALEALARYAEAGNEEATWQQFKKIKQFHVDMMDQLLGKSEPEEDLPLRRKTHQFFEELDRLIRGIILLGDFPRRISDRIMAFGELLSTSIVAEVLSQKGLPIEWLDAREMIKTDANWGGANVISHLTDENLRNSIQPLLDAGKVVITQGYISATTDGRTSTLGREGSDYTAAIIGAALGAEEVRIWKDVPGVMSADPRKFSDAVKIDTLSYQQAVEMTFYGASVIHPKTIKPLHNAGIPLQVSSYVDRESTGTRVMRREKGTADGQTPVAKIIKKNRALLEIRPKDFSFMNQMMMERIIAMSQDMRLEITLLQNTAIALKLLVKDDKERVNTFAAKLRDDYVVERHYDLCLQSYLHREQFDADFALPDGLLLMQADRTRLHLVYPMASADE